MPDATTPVRTLGPLVAVYSDGGFVPDVGGVVRGPGPCALISPWSQDMDDAAFVLAVWQDHKDVVEWRSPGEVFVYRPKGPPSGSLCVVQISPLVQFAVPVLKVQHEDAPDAPDDAEIDAALDAEIADFDWDWSRFLQSENPDQDFAPLRGSLPAVPPSAASGPPPNLATFAPSGRTTVEALAGTRFSILSRLLLRE
jgi:hypothetical protein